MPGESKANQKRHATRTIAILVLLVIPTMTGGCVIILPAIPLNAPGYGHTYKVVYEDDQPVQSGLFLMVSTYWLADPMINCYEIDSGKAAIPIKLATRYGDGRWCALGTPIIGYFGMFHNPRFTQLLPLVTGYVPSWRIKLNQKEEYQDGLHPPPDVIHLVRASPEKERDYLDTCLYGRDGEPIGTAKDKDERKQATEYIKARLKQLPATQPTTATSTAKTKPATMPAPN